MGAPGSLSMNELLLYAHGAAVIQVLRAGVELSIFDLLYKHRALSFEEVDG